jgi:pyruvate dehydrogenase (quinone)
VIDARTDPNMPPMPPHITLEQAKSFFEDADRRFGIEGSSCARPRSN